MHSSVTAAAFCSPAIAISATPFFLSSLPLPLPSLPSCNIGRPLLPLPLPSTSSSSKISLLLPPSLTSRSLQFPCRSLSSFSPLAATIVVSPVTFVCRCHHQCPPRRTFKGCSQSIVAVSSSAAVDSTLSSQACCLSLPTIVVPPWSLLHSLATAALFLLLLSVLIFEPPSALATTAALLLLSSVAVLPYRYCPAVLPPPQQLLQHPHRRQPLPPRPLLLLCFLTLLPSLLTIGDTTVALLHYRCRRCISPADLLQQSTLPSTYYSSDLLATCTPLPTTSIAVIPRYHKRSLSCNHVE
ncbi:hypothetical protein GW17_00047821 [Ensete ventricosum]|nr:hypothetical protein GW17_00047821 [Ensete ventricosum]